MAKGGKGPATKGNSGGKKVGPAKQSAGSSSGKRSSGGSGKAGRTSLPAGSDRKSAPKGGVPFGQVRV